MSRSSAAVSTRIGALAAASAVLVAVMSGCAVREEIPTGPNPGPAVPTSNPSITPTVPAGGTTLDVSCVELVSAQTVYDFNPNYGLIDGFSPAAGTPQAQAIRDGGVACEWMNQTSGDTIVLGASSPGVTVLADLKESAASGTPVAGVGEAAYFSSKDGIGRVDAFDAENWVVVSSRAFGAAEDAQTFVVSALKALPQH
ncbi:hypothetical protein BH09ACT3_BH09ACT3_09630 [soil metagenome]